jgi:hypothetical protein
MNISFRYSLVILTVALGINSLLFSDANAAKKPKRQSPQILRGDYWYKPTGVVLEIIGNRFRYHYDDSPSPSSWNSISKLRYINKGVVVDPKFQVGDTTTYAPYWCLSTLRKNNNEDCTKDGWQKGAE